MAVATGATHELRGMIVNGLSVEQTAPVEESSPLRRPAVVIAGSVLLAIALAGVFAPLLAPYDPRVQLDIIALQNRPPSWADRGMGRGSLPRH